LESCASSYILRSAWLFGKQGPNFVKTMLKVMAEKGEVRVVEDQRGTPTYARDFAAAILRLIDSGKDAFGIYHYTNGGESTWHEFAVAIHAEARAAGMLKTECRIVAIRSDEYPTKARRPPYSVLSKEKIGEVFGIRPPHWRDGLHRYFAEE
jgi:dTDP-4-dehydrorhamnose reductase